jgi:hypothetical protein
MQTTDPNTSIKALQALLDGYRLTSLVYMAAKLGIADLLKDGALSSEQLAASLGADMRAFHRILRALAAIGILSEDPLGQFKLTEIGKCLQSDVPGSLERNENEYRALLEEADFRFMRKINTGGLFSILEALRV